MMIVRIEESRAEARLSVRHRIRSPDELHESVGVRYGASRQLNITVEVPLPKILTGILVPLASQAQALWALVASLFHRRS